MHEQITDTYKWRISQVLLDRRAMFILWAVKTLFCTTADDFLDHYNFTVVELSALLTRLIVEGFLQEDSEDYVLTQMGEDAVKYLGRLEISEFAETERWSQEVETRFGDDDEAIPQLNTSHEESQAQDFWQYREHDRGKPEASLVELPFVQQLAGLGWQYQPGQLGVPESTGRRSFREVVIEKYLRAALIDINRDEQSNTSWLGETQIQSLLTAIRRIMNSNSSSLIQTNRDATRLLVEGMVVPRPSASHPEQTQRAHFIHFDDLQRNHFLVISQFRVDLAGSRYIVPDLVLFVNGIPLVVVECKSPTLTNPVEEGITQLLRYTNQHAISGEFTQGEEAMPELFYFNQLLISTCFFQARFAPLGASYEHFQEWKDPYLPEKYRSLLKTLPETASSQQNLILGMLLPENLLDILYNFTLFDTPAETLIKQVIHYHQFRAVQKAVNRLQSRQTRQQHGEDDQRGGIIWHTQGSGKSLTMVFLVRKMRTIRTLQDFKIVFVTDRKQLEQQLRRTAQQTEEPVHTASVIAELEPLLLPTGPRLVFAMIQKYQMARNTHTNVLLEEDNDLDEEAEEADDVAEDGVKRDINPGENILVIVDEAHRSQTRKLHANLRKMLPNSARIAFTGTPIIRGPGKKTFEIFGNYIDQYTIRQSEQDGATLPILYEGRDVYIKIDRGQLLDERHEDLVGALPHTVRESLYEGYATYREILEGEQAIARKAEDMLLHYTEHILPDGFKAMIVAVSRLAAIRYCNALDKARQQIVARLDDLPLDQRNLREDQIQQLFLSEEEKSLRRIFPYRDLLHQLHFAAVISANAKDVQDSRVEWTRWNDETRNELNIAEFKKPLPSSTDASDGSYLAFLCIRSMLITGFDAPVIQALYLDRSIKNHELLQAIARVNRLSHAKNNGLVIDYYGIAQNLKDALSAYSEADVDGALASIKDEYPLLDNRHRRILALFEAYACDIRDLEACVTLLKDPKIRADFEIKLKRFMQSLEIVLPRQEALRYIADAQQLGVINRAASVTYRDEQLNLISIGNKVRKLIDEHIEVLQIRRVVDPISIHDVNFAQKLKRHRSDENNAAEMASFAREYITYHFAQEDPAYYNKLSERLQSIVDDLQGRWRESVAALQAFIAEITQTREIDKKLNLDPRIELPFFGILEEEVRKGSRRFAIPVNTDGSGRELTEDERIQLAAFTKDLVQEIRRRLLRNDDFWLFPNMSEGLRKDIGGLLEKQGKRLLDPYKRREAVSGRLVTLARYLTTRLRNA